jgi:hypothetical protein
MVPRLAALGPTLLPLALMGGGAVTLDALCTSVSASLAQVRPSEHM